MGYYNNGKTAQRCFHTGGKGGPLQEKKNTKGLLAFIQKVIQKVTFFILVCPVSHRMHILLLLQIDGIVVNVLDELRSF